MAWFATLHRADGDRDQRKISGVGKGMDVEVGSHQVVVGWKVQSETAVVGCPGGKCPDIFLFEFQQRVLGLAQGGASPPCPEIVGCSLLNS
jgi:hypothetical protein